MEDREKEGGDIRGRAGVGWEEGGGEGEGGSRRGAREGTGVGVGVGGGAHGQGHGRHLHEHRGCVGAKEAAEGLMDVAGINLPACGLPEHLEQHVGRQRPEANQRQRQGISSDVIRRIEGGPDEG